MKFEVIVYLRILAYYVFSSGITAKGKTTSLKTFHTPEYYAVDSMQCEQVTIPACKRLGYNDTRIPRFMYLENIRKGDVIQYLRLFENEYCEREMLFFLCTIFNPICFKNYKGHIFPCRSVCEDVKRNCKSVINKFGDKWSSVFDCNNLPEYQTDICIKPKSIVSRSYFDFNIEEQPRLASPIKCNNCPKQRRFKRYRQFEKCDYAIDAQFLSKTTTPDGKTKLQFKLYKAFKSGHTRLRRFDIIDLWSSLPCLCPAIQYDKRYIILGKESKSTHHRVNHMVYDSKTIVVQRTKGLRRILVKWKLKFLSTRRKKTLRCWNNGRENSKVRMSKKCSINEVEKRPGHATSAISYLMKFVRFNLNRSDN